MSGISERLRKARKLRGFTQEQLAVACGWEGNGRVSNYEKGTRSPSASDIELLARVLGVRVSWLWTGEEPMSASPLAGLGLAPSAPLATPSSSLGDVGLLRGWDRTTPLDDDEVEVPIYKEVELSAGPGAPHAIEINGRHLRFSRTTMRAAGVDEANAACATLSGNSMEPLILDGSTVGIDRGRTQVFDGELYAIDHDGWLRVKFLYRTPGGGLRLRSENSAEHPDEVYTSDDARKIRVLGWVFWWSTVRKWRGR